MTFLLDTYTISAHVRRPAGLQARIVQYTGRLYLSSVSLAGLYGHDGGSDLVLGFFTPTKNQEPSLTP